MTSTSIFFTMESSSARDRRRRGGGGSRSKPSKGKIHHDSNHTHSSTDLPGGRKLVAGLGAAITRHHLILLGVGETQHKVYCSCSVARDTVCAAAVGLLIGALHG